MDLDFIKVFAGTLAAFVGIPVLLLVFRIGRGWGEHQKVVAATAATAEETRTSVREFRDEVNPRLARVEFILTGPDGENGLRSDVREVRDRVGVIEQRIGPDRRSKPRGTADRRRKAS